MMFKPFMVVCVCLQTKTFSNGYNLSCPIDKYFNQITQNCTECGAGYYGPDCIIPCRYPNYGRECQEKCHCKENACNFVTGCLMYDTKSSRDDSRSFDQNMAISISLVIGFLLVIAAFILIMKANRRFFSSITRGNAHYVGSTVAEHCVSMHNYSQTQLECNPTPDNNIYACKLH